MLMILKNKETNEIREVPVGRKIVNSENYANKINTSKEAWAFGILRNEWVKKGKIKGIGINEFDLNNELKKEFDKELNELIGKIEYIETKEEE